MRNTETRWKLLQTEGREGEVASSVVGSFNAINFNMALAVSVFASLWNKANENDLQDGCLSAFLGTCLMWYNLISQGLLQSLMFLGLF